MSLNSQMVLSQTKLETQTVGQVQRLRPGKVQKKKPELAHLTLTSLIDCFTILVAYLLAVTHVGTREIPFDSKIQLPVAQHSGFPSEATVVRYKNGQYTVDEKVIAPRELVRELELLREATSVKSLMIQADKETDYESLNPLVLAGLQSGYEKIAFAVMAEDGE
jgi:biopolymer transport protein ExbD